MMLGDGRNWLCFGHCVSQVLECTNSIDSHVVR
jgi:hypothetical protein